MTKRLVLLAGMAAIGFSLTLALCAISSPNPLSSRLGFAVFTSTVPALLTALAPVRSKALVVSTYFTLFVVLQVGMWVVKGWEEW